MMPEICMAFSWCFPYNKDTPSIFGRSFFTTILHSSAAGSCRHVSRIWRNSSSFPLAAQVRRGKHTTKPNTVRRIITIKCKNIASCRKSDASSCCCLLPPMLLGVQAAQVVLLCGASRGSICYRNQHALGV